MTCQEWKDREGQTFVDREGQEWVDRHTAVIPEHDPVVDELVKTEADVTSNSDFLEGKPRQSAQLKDICDRINAIIQDDLVQPALDVERMANILTAEGVWLDYWGSRLKYPRPQIGVTDANWFGFDGNGLGFDQANFVPEGEGKTGIADDAYRALLIIRGSQLITDGSIPSFSEILQGVFGFGSYIDNGNMTVDIVIDDSQTDIMIKTLVDSGIIPKGAGIGINSITISNSAGNFGFDGNGVGFDQANFARDISEL